MNWNQLLSSNRIRSFSKSTTSNDLRTEFEKDYHRIIGSASFRRLQDKTQVFPLDKSDYIRTRLTHSLEVSSFAKSLGQNVAEKILTGKKDKDFTIQNKQEICDILQCAGLIHDIGNPPFGHFGETSIQEWFKENLKKLSMNGITLSEILKEQMQQDFYNFEGNTQALRVVTKLHFLVDENGMNLTNALLATIIKYPVSSLNVNKKSGNIKDKKMGYFYADQKTYETIESNVKTKGARHPLTFLLEAADDIAYKTADIEDAVKKKCISYNDLLQELHKKGKSTYKDKYVNSDYYKMVTRLEEKYKKAVDNHYETPEMYAIQNWVVAIQGKLLFAASDSFIEHYDEIMAGTYDKDLFAGTDVITIMDALGDIAYRYVFTSKPIYKIEISAEMILNFLFDKFVNAIIYYDTDKKLTSVHEKLVSLISEDYKRIYHKYAKGLPEEEKLYLRLLLVTDYICGMTDHYAKNLYQELNGIL
ncbi:MAG: deoxyguanosinetriphosphate triphosphohydrolase [Lachnospiraceae bacterium]